MSPQFPLLYPPHLTRPRSTCKTVTRPVIQLHSIFQRLSRCAAQSVANAVQHTAQACESSRQCRPLTVHDLDHHESFRGTGMPGWVDGKQASKRLVSNKVLCCAASVRSSWKERSPGGSLGLQETWRSSTRLATPTATLSFCTSPPGGPCPGLPHLLADKPERGLDICRHCGGCL